MQIFALVLLLVSAVILNLDAITGAAQEQQQEQDSEQCEDCSSNIKHTLSDLLFAEQNVAVLCVVAASMISGLSAALTQKVLQKKGTNSILVSAQLAVYGILFLTAKELLLNQATTAAEASSLLAGWDCADQCLGRLSHWPRHATCGVRHEGLCSYYWAAGYWGSTVGRGWYWAENY